VLLHAAPPDYTLTRHLISMGLAINSAWSPVETGHSAAESGILLLFRLRSQDLWMAVGVLPQAHSAVPTLRHMCSLET